MMELKKMETDFLNQNQLLNRESLQAHFGQMEDSDEEDEDEEEEFGNNQNQEEDDDEEGFQMV